MSYSALIFVAVALGEHGKFVEEVFFFGADLQVFVNKKKRRKSSK